MSSWWLITGVTCYICSCCLMPYPNLIYCWVLVFCTTSVFSVLWTATFIRYFFFWYCHIAWCHIRCTTFIYELSVFGFSKFFLPLLIFTSSMGLKFILICVSLIFSDVLSSFSTMSALYHINSKSYNQK